MVLKLEINYFYIHRLLSLIKDKEVNGLNLIVL